MSIFSLHVAECDVVDDGARRYFTKAPPKKKEPKKTGASSSASAYASPQPGSSSPGPSSGPPRDAIEDLEKRTLGIDWRDALKAEFSKPYFAKVCFFSLG